MGPCELVYDIAHSAPVNGVLCSYCYLCHTLYPIRIEDSEYDWLRKFSGGILGTSLIPMLTVTELIRYETGCYRIIKVLFMCPEREVIWIVTYLVMTKVPYN